RVRPRWIAWPRGVLTSPLPLWERMASASRVRGRRLRRGRTPHPPSFGFASTQAPFPTRGEGKACLPPGLSTFTSPPNGHQRRTHPAGSRPPPPGPGGAGHGPLHRGAAQRSAQRRGALLRRGDRLPGGPVSPGHRSRPPLAPLPGRPGARPQPHRQGAAPHGQDQGRARGLRPGARLRHQFRRRLCQPRQYAQRTRPPHRGAVELRPGAGAQRRLAERLAQPRRHAARLWRMDEAIASYDRAIALDKNFSVAHFNRANVLHELGRLDEAIEGYDRALALAPKVVEVHLGRAYALMALGRLEESLAAADRAAELDAELPGPHEARAAILHALGRAGDASAARDKAAELKKRAAEKKAAENQPAAAGHSSV